jgi:hypothetical protein
LKRIFFHFLLVTIFFSNALSAQTGFKFYGKNIKQQKTRFKLINNLIVIPLNINGKKLSFILDTGVNKTILFNLSQNDSIGLRNVKKVQLQGLGNGKSVEALVSKKNKLRIKNLISGNETVYVILNDNFDLSGKMGITINGIIGYNLLKDLIVKINYHTRQITFYNPKKYKQRKCRRCETFPLQFYRKKPFIDVSIQLDTIGNKKTPVKMLIDSGGSDAIWLFEDTKAIIKTPKKYYRDILGEGLSGTIYGNRSRVQLFSIGRFNIEKPTVSFLDTLSTVNARDFKQRNGSIGGDILKRFKVWIDYPNKQITLKKNGSFRAGFKYNMSGLDVVYNGKKLIEVVNLKKADIYTSSSIGTTENATISFSTNYTYKFKPSYRIHKVLKNSNAEKAGLLVGDVLIKLNGKPVHDFSLGDIVNKFQERDKKKIKLIIERYGVKMKFEFRLEKRI